MRFEATLPDPRGAAALKLAKELGLSRSQLVDEALALFAKVVLEVRRGRRLMMFDPSGERAVCELATPTLTALEWAAQPQPITFTDAEAAKIEELNREPPRPTESLERAARAHEEWLRNRSD